MFKQRLISGIILVLIAVVTLYFGGIPTFLVTGIISLIGYYELLRVFHSEKTILGVAAYTVTIVYYLLLLLDLNNFILFLAIFYLMVLMAIYVFAFPKYKFPQVMCAYFGFFYVVMMLSCLYQIRVMNSGGALIVLVFLSSWGSDTLAYCTGMLFGKHKMTPKLSPKKTIEGGIGGVLGAGILGFLYGFIFKDIINISVSAPILCGVVCVVGALLSMVGDLGASAIKRDCEIKDYGTLIPGHGGILDRFDSIIFTAPVIFYLTNFFL